MTDAIDVRFSKVVDAALYDSTSSQSSNFVAEPFVLQVPTTTALNVTLTWTLLSSSNATDYTVYWTNSTLSTSGSISSGVSCSSQCTLTRPKAIYGGSGSVTFRVELNSPNRSTGSQTITF